MLLQAANDSSNTGDLFVLTASSATLTMTGEKGSLQVSHPEHSLTH